MVYNKFIYGQENGHDTIDHIGKEDHGMKERFYRFMQGRYGQDAFSRFLLGITGLCLLFNVLLHNRFLGVLAWALLIYTYYRIFSKNHSARYEENQSGLEVSAGDGKSTLLGRSAEKTVAGAQVSPYLYLSEMPAEDPDSQRKRQDYGPLSKVSA